jgi:hypothetical protein
MGALGQNVQWEKIFESCPLFGLVTPSFWRWSPVRASHLRLIGTGGTVTRREQARAGVGGARRRLAAARAPRRILPISGQMAGDGSRSPVCSSGGYFNCAELNCAMNI